MNATRSFKRKTLYISWLSCLAFTIMETQANELVTFSEDDDPVIHRALSPELVCNTNRALDGHTPVDILLAADNRVNNSTNTVQPDSYIPQEMSGAVNLAMQNPLEDALSFCTLKLSGATVFSNNPIFAYEIENDDAEIKNSIIHNNVGGGIDFINRNAGIIDNVDRVDFFTPKATINKSTLFVKNGIGLSSQLYDMDINNSVIVAGNKNDKIHNALGILIKSYDTEIQDHIDCNISNSKIKVYGDGIHIVGGDSTIRNSAITANGISAIITEGGNLTLNRTLLTANNNANGIYTLAGESALYDVNKIIIDNSVINTINNTAIVINQRETNSHHINKTHIMLKNNSHINPGNGVILQSLNKSQVLLAVTDSQIMGQIAAEPDSIINIGLYKNALFSGHIKNVSGFSSTPHSLWKMSASSDLQFLHHSGSIVITNDRNKASELLIHNQYVGNNGTLTLHSPVTDGRLLSDKLIISGNSHGNTNIAINNIGGIAANRLNNLELIHVDGMSNAVFNQTARIVAGGYDYSVVRGQGHERGNWYLSNQSAHSTAKSFPVIRPEAASYIANLSVANNLFASSMNNRPSETEYIDSFTGEKKRTRLWLQQSGQHQRWRDNSSQLKNQTNTTVTQLGGDIFRWSINNRERLHVGLTIGQGTGRSNSHSSVTNYHAKSVVSGYSIGSYASWRNNNSDKSGPYIHSWLQYNWFKNRINGQGISAEQYLSKGINSSFESGYTFVAGQRGDDNKNVTSWFIQPQAQITWMNVKASQHREANGSRITGKGEGNIQARFGIRTSLKGQHSRDRHKNREFEPFIEANWLHNSRDFSVQMDDTHIVQAGARNIGEVKIGINAKLNRKLNLWGNIGTQMGDKGYNNTSIIAGIKYHF